MNEQAQKVILDLLQKASDGIDSAVSFSQAQIPDVVEQLLVWNVVISLIGFIIGLVIISIGVSAPFVATLARKRNAAWTSMGEYYNITSTAYDLSFNLIPMTCITVGFLVSSLNMDWLKIWIAPKLYLIEYAASLMK